MSDVSLWRALVFLTVFLSVWTGMNAYVVWRAATVPFLAAHLSRRALFTIAVVLWLSLPLAMFLDRARVGVPAAPLVFVAMNWLGVLFLVMSALLVVEVVTGGGFLLPKLAPVMREWALAAAGALSVIGLAQGLRDPVIHDYEVTLAGLPKERDGTVLVEVSDIHLGTLIGERWMARLVERVNAMKPDITVVDGDLVDGNVNRVEPLLPVLKGLRAPLGVWAVSGNHEFYAGLARCVKLFQDAGYTVLQDRWAEVVPGLVFAGVDDLTARRQLGKDGPAIEKALSGRPAGATVLLSHSPLRAETAAAAGAGLMLSGHTHDGQIWPFGYFVKPVYPLLGGRYQVGRMAVIVCRGTGTWGPRMRLWLPSEIVRITLRAGAA